jgi:hypothetical protein
MKLSSAVVTVRSSEMAWIKGDTEADGIFPGELAIYHIATV